jgi:hypothetical protein
MKRSRTPSLDFKRPRRGMIQQATLGREAREFLGGTSGGLLAEADHVSTGIAESRGNLRNVRAEPPNDFAAVGFDGVNGRDHAVHHDAKEEAGLCCGAFRSSLVCLSLVLAISD